VSTSDGTVSKVCGNGYYSVAVDGYELLAKKAGKIRSRYLSPGDHVEVTPLDGRRGIITAVLEPAMLARPPVQTRREDVAAYQCGTCGHEKMRHTLVIQAGRRGCTSASCPCVDYVAPAKESAT
jgi:translation initiation factor IF-1